MRDARANLAVLLASLGVFGTGQGWPDLTVVAVMALLALQCAFIVVRHSLRQLHCVRGTQAGQPARGAT